MSTTRFASPLFRRSAAMPAFAMLTVLIAASPARADRCDDLAAQLKSHIDGLQIGKTAANVILLSHPAARQIRLGCASRNITNEVYAASGSRKPSAAFLDMVASATAIIFTIPKSDTLKGVTRCFGRIGLFRGDDIKTRYRRLDMRCTRAKADSAITISRGKDE